MTYCNRYLKYKSKYLDSKKQIGGVLIEEQQIKDAIIQVNLDSNHLRLLSEELKGNRYVVLTAVR
jgi:hypothetical protein